MRAVLGHMAVGRRGEKGRWTALSGVCTAPGAKGKATFYGKMGFETRVIEVAFDE